MNEVEHPQLHARHQSDKLCFFLRLGC